MGVVLREMENRRAEWSSRRLGLREGRLERGSFDLNRAITKGRLRRLRRLHSGSG